MKISLLVLVACQLKMAVSWAQQELDSWSQPVIQNAVAQVSDSVVQIETVGGLESVQGVQTTTGPTTGMVISEDGFVLTSSFNLIQQPSAIFVRLRSGTRLPAEIVARNDSRQVVLLKTNPSEALPVPNFIERSQLRVGQSAIAVGKVFDAASPNVSTGIVSATHRIWGRAIQTDAKISPNNFGGPLIDINGNVIGVLVPMSPSSDDVIEGSDWYDSGIGFAIPLDELRLSEMAKGQNLDSGLMGVTFAEKRGYASPAEIAACAQNSPAASAGLKAGDRIVRINGTEISRLSQARHALGPLYAGDTVSLAYDRDGEVIETQLQLASEIKPYQHGMLGILPVADAFTSDDGVTIKNCRADGPAAASGLRPGDRIIAVAGEPVGNTIELVQQMITLSIGDSIAVDFFRGAAEQTVTVVIDELQADVFDDSSAQSPENTAPPKSGEAKIQQIKIPEQGGICHAYVPGGSPGQPLGALLWLGPPGEFDPALAIQPWRDFCDQRQIVLIVPQSQNARAWMPTEIEFLSKAVQQISTEYNINPQKVAVGGTSSGAVLASLVAFTKRSQFRGLILHNSPMSGRIRNVRSSAVERLLVLILCTEGDDQLKRRIEDDRSRLADSGFPVHVVANPVSSGPTGISAIPRDDLITWVDQLDRF